VNVTPRQERRLVAVGLVGLWFVWFSPQLLSSGIPFRRDTLMLYLPIRQFLHEELRAFRLPQWFPYEGIGVPFIGQFVTATFHPETWLLLPLSPAVALKLNILGAYLIALVGGYRFSRLFDVPRVAAVCGGAALAFSGYALSVSDNLPFLMGLATLPWVGWAAMRLALHGRPKDTALLGLLWASVLLAGDVQSFVMAGPLVVASLLAGRASLRSVLWSVFGFALSLGLAAVELLPARSVFSTSTRLNSGFVIDPATYWALQLGRLPEFILPHFLPEPRQQARELLFGESYQWASSIFAGGVVLVVAMAALSRPTARMGVFLVLALGALWLATGGRGHLLPMVWKILPPLASFRFPEKYLALFSVALVPVVALGAARVLSDRTRWAGAFLAGAFVALLFSLMAHSDRLLAALVAEHGDARDLALDITATWSRGLQTTAEVLAVTGGVLWLLRRQSWGGVALPVLLAGELWLGNHDVLPLAPKELLDPPASAFASALLSESGRSPVRLISAASARPESPNDKVGYAEAAQRALHLLRPDVAGLFHASTVGASALPGQSERTRAVLGTLGSRAPQFGPLFGACSNVIDEDPGAPTKALARDEQDGLVLAPMACRSAAYFADMKPAPPLPQLAGALSKLRDDEALWEGPTLSAPRVFDVTPVSWEPGRIQLTAETSEHAALVVSEGYVAPAAFESGWHATVDAAPVEIHPANGIAMGIEVPEGKHNVVFTYSTPGLKIGAGVSLISLLICLVLLLSKGPSGNLGEQDMGEEEPHPEESGPAGV
jgi:hypothetical protein